MVFELVEVGNGFILKIGIPNEGDITDLIVWQERHDDKLSAFAHFLEEVAKNYGPKDDKNEIIVTVLPKRENLS